MCAHDQPFAVALAPPIDRYVEGMFVGADTIIDPAIDLWRLDVP